MYKLKKKWQCPYRPPKSPTHQRNGQRQINPLKSMIHPRLTRCYTGVSQMSRRQHKYRCIFFSLLTPVAKKTIHHWRPERARQEVIVAGSSHLCEKRRWNPDEHVKSQEITARKTEKERKSHLCSNNTLYSSGRGGGVGWGGGVSNKTNAVNSFKKQSAD